MEQQRLAHLDDPWGVVTGASILFEGGGLPLPPDSLVPPSDEVDMDGVRGVVLGDYNAYLEGEGGSFPSPQPSIILRLSSGCLLSLFLYSLPPFVASYLRRVEGVRFTVLLGFPSS